MAWEYIKKSIFSERNEEPLSICSVCDDLKDTSSVCIGHVERERRREEKRKNDRNRSECNEPVNAIRLGDESSSSIPEPTPGWSGGENFESEYKTDDPGYYSSNTERKRITRRESGLSDTEHKQHKQGRSPRTRSISHEQKNKRPRIGEVGEVESFTLNVGKKIIECYSTSSEERSAAPTSRKAARNRSGSREQNSQHSPRLSPHRKTSNQSTIPTTRLSQERIIPIKLTSDQTLVIAKIDRKDSKTTSALTELLSTKERPKRRRSSDGALVHQRSSDDSSSNSTVKVQRKNDRKKRSRSISNKINTDGIYESITKITKIKLGSRESVSSGRSSEKKPKTHRSRRKSSCDRDGQDCQDTRTQKSPGKSSESCRRTGSKESVRSSSRGQRDSDTSEIIDTLRNLANRLEIGKTSVKIVESTRRSSSTDSQGKIELRSGGRSASLQSNSSKRNLHSPSYEAYLSADDQLKSPNSQRRTGGDRSHRSGSRDYKTKTNKHKIDENMKKMFPTKQMNQTEVSRKSLKPHRATKEEKRSGPMKASLVFTGASSRNGTETDSLSEERVSGSNISKKLYEVSSRSRSSKSKSYNYRPKPE